MSTSLSPLLAPMLSGPAMRAVCDDVACLQHMLDFEAAPAGKEAVAEALINRLPAPSTTGKMPEIRNLEKFRCR